MISLDTDPLSFLRIASSVALSDNTHGWSKTFINEEEERLFTGFIEQKR